MQYNNSLLKCIDISGLFAPGWVSRFNWDTPSPLSWGCNENRQQENQILIVLSGYMMERRMFV